MSCGGHVEDNETLSEAVRREVKEELNLNIEFLNISNFKKVLNEEPLPFVSLTKNLKEKRIQIFEFLCKVNSLEGLKHKENELDSYKLFSREDIENSNNLSDMQKDILDKAFDIINNLMK